MGSVETVELVRRAQDGDHLALENVFVRCYDRVRRIVRMRLGDELRGELESADILQETFLAAVEDFERFELRDDAGIVHWLARIAENRIRVNVRRVRAQKRDRRREVALRRITDSISSGTLQLQVSDSVTLPDRAVEKEEERTRIELAISTLRPEYRDVILERDYVGGAWRDVADRIGSPSPEAARMLHARAMVELAGLLRRSSD